ncbi:hypothetical protein C8R44DRAFT_989883, partial [Mycena epipterygia]
MPPTMVHALRRYLQLTELRPSRGDTMLEKIPFMIEQEEEPQLQANHVVYPVLTLPPEITSEIFIRCLPSGPEPGSQSPWHSSRAPWLLLEICKMWRAIALSTPALWAVLHLDMQHRWAREANLDSETLCKAVESWFRKAGTVPLSLTLRGWDYERGPSCFPAIVGLCGSRLRQLNLGMGLDDFYHLPDADVFSALQHLTIASHVAGTAQALQSRIPAQVFRGALKLRTVVCTHLNGHFRSVDFLPWTRLTSFTCKTIAPDDFLCVLRMAPRLVQCTAGVQVRYNEPTPDLVDPFLLHLSLESMILLDHSSAHILQLLTLPALQTLRFSNERHLEDHLFLQFLRRSATALRTFSCESFNGAGVSVDAIHAMVHLTHLELSRVSGTFKGDLFRMLNRESEPEALPNLADISITDYGGSIKDNVVEAPESRCIGSAGLARLQSFRATRQDDCDPMLIKKNHSARLRQLASQGMRIHIGSDTQNVL